MLFYVSKQGDLVLYAMRVGMYVCLLCVYVCALCLSVVRCMECYVMYVCMLRMRVSTI